jgi:hypothetical protein
LFLQRSYYKPGLSDVGLRMTIGQGHEVTNEWVSDTPSEFRSKLSKVFNLGVVKCEILSLVSNSPAVQEHNEEESGEEKESKEE